MNASYSPLTISVIARKGGVGKSMCTTLFARAYANSGLRVLVVDLAPQATTTKALLTREQVRELDIEESSSAFAAGESLLPYLTKSPQRGLRVAPSGEPLELASDRLRLDALALSNVQESLSTLADAQADLVIIDTPPDYGTLTLGALSFARWAVVVSECKRESVQEVPQALKTIARLKSLNPSLSLLGIVANKLDRRRSEVNKAMKPVPSVDFRAHGLPAVVEVAEELLRRHSAATRKMAHAG
ncbi:MAG: ParA family protein [Planctomycetota bacterium]